MHQDVLSLYMRIDDIRIATQPTSMIAQMLLIACYPPTSTHSIPRITPRPAAAPFVQLSPVNQVESHTSARCASPTPASALVPNHDEPNLPTRFHVGSRAAHVQSVGVSRPPSSAPRFRFQPERRRKQSPHRTSRTLRHADGLRGCPWPVGSAPAVPLQW